MVTLIEEDKPLMAEYNEFQKLVEACNDEDFEADDDNKSKWIIRMELNKESMLDKHISMDDIHFAVSNSYSDDITCVYSDMNADKLVFRIRLTKSNYSSKKHSLDQSDEIYKLKNFQNNLLNNIILRGVKHIPKVLLRKIVDEVILDDANYVQKDGWVLDTVGTNLRDILTLSSINSNKTFSNDIQEVYRTLGLEAARQAIFNELSEAMDHAGVYINYHHLSILCDRMCATSKMVSIFRHGINNDDIGPIAKASFEETPEMFLRAARHAELDLMTGVSSNIMCGQEGYFGTGSFQVMLDINKMKGNKSLEQNIDIQSMMQGENPSDPCSLQNILISNTAEFITGKDTGDIDDEYDPGF
jgi:DNA-directed RNA polymerase II subunit RPB1